MIHLKSHQRILLSWFLIQWDIYSQILTPVYFLLYTLFVYESSLRVASVCFEYIHYLILFVSCAISPFAVPFHSWGSFLAYRHGVSLIISSMESIQTTIVRMIILSLFYVMVNSNIHLFISWLVKNPWFLFLTFVFLFFLKVSKKPFLGCQWPKLT